MKNKCKKISLLILAVLILFTGSMVGYAYNVNLIRNIQNENTIRMKTDEFNKIYLFLMICRDKANENIRSISTSIEKDIKEKYPDLSVLKDELQTDNYKSIYPIISENVKDKFFGGVENGNNDIFVTTLTNIIVDFSYNNSTIVSDKDQSKLRTWDDIISTQYNKEMAEYAKNQIINKSRDLIIWERTKSSNPDHIKISEPTYENLLKVYLNEGIDGLKNYTSLVPSYITDNGDIFDNSDFKEGGVRLQNYKLIIIQEFNIYDQIKQNYPELFNDSIGEKLSNDNTAMSHIYILGIVLSISYISTIILLMSIFNTYILPKNNEDEENNTI